MKNYDKQDKDKKYQIIGLIALTVVALTVFLVAAQGQVLEGYLRLSAPATSSNIAGQMRGYSPEPLPYSPEPTPVKDPITRAELAKLIVAALNVDASAYKACTPDVVGKWFENYVCYVMAKGIIAAYTDGTFKPNNNVLRAEGAKVFTLAFIPKAQLYAGKMLLFKDVKPADWFYVYVMTLAQKHILDGDPVLSGNTLPNISTQAPNTTLKTGSFLPSNLLTKTSALVWAQNVPGKTLTK